MRYLLKKGTLIAPYNSKDGVVGLPYEASVEFSFDDTQVLERLERNELNYLKLSLGNNSSKFDSFLVEEKKVSV